jgi:hypothetical protein
MLTATDRRSTALLSTDYCQLTTEPGGAGRDRTDDLVLAKHALSQLSYSPGFS